VKAIALHFYQEHYEFHLEPAFDFKTVLRILNNRMKGDDEADEAYSHSKLISEEAILSIDNCILQKFMATKRDAWDATCLEAMYGAGEQSVDPITDLTPEDMLECAIENKGMLEESLGIAAMPTTKGVEEYLNKMYTVKEKELLDTMTMVSAAAAARYDRDNSISLKGSPPIFFLTCFTRE